MRQLQSLLVLARSQATYKDFANKLYHTADVSSSSRFSKPKLDQTGFTIDHYAGEVRFAAGSVARRFADITKTRRMMVVIRAI